jgi:hypothetical protein
MPIVEIAGGSHNDFTATLGGNARKFMSGLRALLAVNYLLRQFVIDTDVTAGSVGEPSATILIACWT